MTQGRSKKKKKTQVRRTYAERGGPDPAPARGRRSCHGGPWRKSERCLGPVLDQSWTATRVPGLEICRVISRVTGRIPAPCFLSVRVLSRPGTGTGPGTGPGSVRSAAGLLWRWGLRDARGGGWSGGRRHGGGQRQSRVRSNGCWMQVQVGQSSGGYRSALQEAWEASPPSAGMGGDLCLDLAWQEGERGRATNGKAGKQAAGREREKSWA